MRSDAPEVKGGLVAFGCAQAGAVGQRREASSAGRRYFFMPGQGVVVICGTSRSVTALL